MKSCQVLILRQKPHGRAVTGTFQTVSALSAQHDMQQGLQCQKMF